MQIIKYTILGLKITSILALILCLPAAMVVVMLSGGSQISGSRLEILQYTFNILLLFPLTAVVAFFLDRKKRRESHHPAYRIFIWASVNLLILTATTLFIYSSM
jgi:hypothetical protein